MSYLKVTNGKAETYTIGQLRRDNPNTSFPKNISDEILNSFNVYKVTQKPEPSYDSLTEYVELKDPENVDGEWIRDWEVKKFDENIAASRVRSERDKLLSETVDRMNPMRWESLTTNEKERWVNYRQKLLNVPNQKSFPYSVVWPSIPNNID